MSILFLSDGAQTRGLLQPLEGAKLAKEACFPVYTDRARNAARSHRARPVRRLSAGPAGRPGDSGSARSGDAAPDRARRPAASSRKRARRTRSSARTRTSARGWAASLVRARSRGCSSRSRPRSCSSRRRSARSSRRASRRSDDHQREREVGPVVASRRMHGHPEHAAGRRLAPSRTRLAVALPTALAPEIPTKRTSKTPTSTRLRLNGLSGAVELPAEEIPAAVKLSGKFAMP